MNLKSVDKNIRVEMPSLSESELKVVDQACAGDVLSTTAIRLYQATKPTEYTYSQTGAIALLRNPISGYSFKMVDLNVLR